MDQEGMLPQHPCKNCGKMLNADGYHPAELYLGTYTGLCYDCEGKGPFIVDEYIDGAKRISYPPNSPAWSREREEYVAYADCPECKGKGMTRVSKSAPHGGSFRKFCKTCSQRFYLHPVRARFFERYRRWVECIYEIAEGLFIQSVIELGHDPDNYTPQTLQNPQVQELALKYRGRYKELIAKANLLFQDPTKKEA